MRVKLELQPKQSLVYTSEATEILYGGAAGSGKAGDINIPVPTVDGFKRLGEIRAGDKVFGTDGKPCNVVAVTDVMYGRPCYRVTFSDGNEFTVDEQHQWLVQVNDKTRVQTTRQIHDTQGHTKYIMPRVSPIEYPHCLNHKFELVDRYIKSVEPVESIPVRCIQVDSEDSCFLWGRGYVPTHNSHLMRVLAISYCMQVPNLQVYLFRRRYGDLKSNHMESASGFPVMLAELVESKYVKIQHDSYDIRFWNNSVIHLRHLQHEKDLLNYQGAEIHILLIDELTHFTESMYRYLRGRVRLGGLGIPDGLKAKLPLIVSGANPGGIGHSFVKATFIDGSPPMGIRLMGADEGGFKRQYIPARLSDNAILSLNDPNYADRLSGLGDPVLVRAMLEGDWSIVAGGALDDVWHPQSQVKPVFKVLDGQVVHRAYDWGQSKPWACVWYIISNGEEITLPDNRIWVPAAGSYIFINEVYGWNGKSDEGDGRTIAEQAKRIKQIDSQYKRVVAGPADNMIWDVRNGQKSFAEEFMEHGVKWVRSDKSPGSRIRGLSLMRAMLSNTKGLEKGGMYFTTACEQIIRTFPVLPRDKSVLDDVDSAAEDHLYDAVRYAVMSKNARPSFAKVLGF